METNIRQTEPPFTVEEVAKRFSLHPVTVRRWIREKRLKCIHIGRAVRIPVQEVIALQNGERP
jgi:excisionase family DNA binding protein